MTDVRQVAEVDNWRAVKVALVGDVAVDAYWHVEACSEELSVETGLPVQHVANQRYELGGAGNVGANLVSLGLSDVRVLGVRGQDPFGVAMMGLLTRLGIDASGVQCLAEGWATLSYVKPILAGEEQARLELGSRGTLPTPALELLTADLRAAASWADVVVFNQQVAGPFVQPDVIAMLNALIADHPATLFVVDARDCALDLKGALLKMNCQEAAAFVEGGAASGRLSLEHVRALAEKIAGQTGQPVVITRGDRGMVAADRIGTYETLGVSITGAVDPVGAGDTVVAALAAALGAGQSLARAVELANFAASVTVQKTQTTGTVNPTELRAAAADNDLVYDPELAENPTRARYLAGSEIELVCALPRKLAVSHAIFDHDGTLSTLRQGWEDVMEPMMVKAVLGDTFADTDAATYQKVRAEVASFIDRTTGIQTLVQMKGLAGLVRRFGFVPEELVRDEHGYKAIYNDELMSVVRGRIGKLDRGELLREDFHIKGARIVLERLRDSGVALYLASGTDHDDVVAEATALGFAEFFGEQIYGSIGDVAVEAKRVVLERIIGDNNLSGENIVTFGDGPVELRETRKRGGVAVGLCSDETRRFGVNPAKRPRLIRGGAHLLVPDFSTVDTLLGELCLV